MPRDLHEIKNFNAGTVYNQDEKDISSDANIFSLNLNPVSQFGILEGINTDKLLTSIDGNLTFFRDPVTIDSTVNNQASATNYNNSKIHLDDITILEDNPLPTVKVDGTAGMREILYLKNIEPLFEKLLFTGGAAAGTAAYYTFTSNEVLAADNTYIQLESFILNEDSTISNFVAVNSSETVIEITIDSTNASTYDGEYFTLTTSNGKAITYEFDNDASGPATGEVISSTRVCIQLYDLSSLANFIAQTKAAIANATRGHYQNVFMVDNGALGKLAITDLTKLTHHLSEGDYFSFIGTGGTFTGRTGYEIIKVLTYDSSTKRLNIKRNCFGSPTSTMTDETAYDIYVQRITTGAVLAENQMKTNAGSCEILDFASKGIMPLTDVANNIGGHSGYLTKCDSDAEKEYQGVFDSSVANQEIIYDVGSSSTNTPKTIKFGSTLNTQNFNFRKGDIISIYHSNQGNNNGNRYKILGVGTSLTTDGWTVELLDGTMVSETESSATIFIESNIVKNHTFHHASNASGATARFLVDGWEHKYYYYSASGFGPYNYYMGRAVNSLYNSGEETVLVTSGGVWDDSTGNSPYETADASANYYPYQSGDYYVKIISEYAAFNSSDNSLDAYLSIAATADTTILEFNLDMTYRLAYNDIITFENVGYDGDTEYIRVLSVNGNLVSVERGFYNTTPVTIAASSSNYVWKNLNHHLQQDVDVSLLKKGQKYKFSFYAKDNNTSPSATHNSAGALALVYNGGYFNSNGEWNPFPDNTNH